MNGTKGVCSMNIAICEDEELYQQMLLKQLNNYQEQCHKKLMIEWFKNGEELMEIYRYSSHRFDVVFLDIKLEGVSGMEVAKKIREMDQQVELIFLTSLMEYAIEGYQVNALRYLLKPIEQGQLNELLELIAGKRKEEVLTISTKFGQKKILLKDITYIESKQRKLYFYSNQEVDRMYGKMGELAASLAKKNFFRPHQSYLVQLEFVKELKKDHLILVDGSVIPVSKGNAKSFKAAFFDYLSQDGDSYG